MASNEGIDIYYDYVVREKRNSYEVLFDFQSVIIPFAFLIDSIGISYQYRVYQAETLLDRLQFRITKNQNFSCN